MAPPLPSTRALRGFTRIAAAALLGLAAALPAAAESRKTDVVVMDSGDHVTGETKKLDRGMLRLSTDSLGTLDIEWAHVARLTSKFDMEVELSDGSRYFGSLGEPSEARKLAVIGTERTVELDMAEVVRITPIRRKFWARIDGSLSLGFSFTKASDVSQLTFGGNASYRTREYRTKLSLNSIVTDQETGTTKRQDLTYSYTRFLGKKRFALGWLSFQQNDELGIDFRVLLGGGAGRSFIETNRSRLSLLGGLVVNREQVDGPDAVTEDLELVGGLQFAMFQYDNPETDISTNLFVFPSLTTSGRYRVEFDTSLKRELVNDFYLDLALYYSFDSDPPPGALSDADYGIVLSLGYSF